MNSQPARAITASPGAQALAPKPASRRASWLAVALTAAVMLYVFPYQAEINNPNENVRFYMTAAMVEQGTYAIDAIRARWGWVNDAAVAKGHVYSVKAPGTSFLGVPGYAAYRAYCKWRGVPLDRTAALWVVRVTGSVLPMLAFWLLFHGWLRRQTRHALLADAVYVSAALGSLLLGYGLLFVSHSVSAAAAATAFVLLFEARRTGSLGIASALLAGLCAAGVTFFEYPGLIASVLLSAYALWACRPWHRLAWFGAGALLPTLLVMHFHARAFGSPFTPGHAMLESESFRALMHQGFFGATGFHKDAAWALLFDPGFGLLPLTPVLAMAFIGFPRLLVRRETRWDAAVAVLLVALTWLAICLMNNWRGGWTIGPRYLAVLVPFFAWAALIGLDGLAGWRRLGRAGPLLAFALGWGAMLAALAASGLPSLYYPHYPEEIARPLSQVVAPLIRHDFAPFNAGMWLGLRGTRSMLPLLALGLALLGWVAWQAPGWRARVATVLGGLAVAAALIVPVWRVPAGSPDVGETVATIERTW